MLKAGSSPALFQQVASCVLDFPGSVCVCGVCGGSAVNTFMRPGSHTSVVQRVTRPLKMRKRGIEFGFDFTFVSIIIIFLLTLSKVMSQGIVLLEKEEK